MDAETFEAINRAVGRAIDLINSDKRRFTPYMIDDPKFAEVAKRWGGLAPEDFHLPRLRYTHQTPYTDEIVEDTYNWMVRWGLLSDAVCATDVVENRLAETAGAAAAD
jgi:NitT/TauT family transport system substrate-binding protein